MPRGLALGLCVVVGAAAAATVGLAQRPFPPGGTPWAQPTRALPYPDPYTYFSGQSRQAALAGYPYSSFLKHVVFTDFARIERHRERLNQINPSLGDFFLARLTDEFLLRYPITDAQMGAKIDIGEAYLRHGAWTRTMVYRVAGFHVLSSVARRMEANIKAGRMSAGDDRIAPLINRLEKNKVYLALQPSRLQKLVQRVKDCIGDRRRCLYLWNRFQVYAGELARKVGLRSAADGDRYTLTPQAGAYGGAAGGEPPVSVFRLTRKGEHVGHVLWMQQPPLRAAFLANHPRGNAVQALRAANPREIRHVVAAMTGAYTDGAGVPDGLTAHRGQIVNPVVLPDRDGLVLFAPDGAIQILNLKNPNSQLCNATLNVRQSLVHLLALVECIREKRYTAFQTHLLAYGDTPLMALGQGKSDERERRALAIARRGNERHHVLFDLPKPHDLAELLHAIYRTLKRRNLTVEAILNLDTGSYNILHFYGQDGRLMLEPRGPVGLERATNLLVYFVN